MEELKTKRKTSKTILRIPKWQDLPLSAALFLVSRASVLGGLPMAVPFFAAACDCSAAYIYLPVLLLGTMSAGGNFLKYFLASLIFWLISEFRLRGAHRFTNAIICGGLVILCGFLSAVFSENPVNSILFLIIEGILSGVMYYAFSNTKLFFDRFEHSKHVTREEIISFIIFVCAMIAGLSGIVLPLDINIAQLVGTYLILCVVMYINLPAAVCFALAVGFVSSQMSSDAILMMGIMGAGAIFASLLKQYGKYGIVAGYFIGIAVSLLYTANNYSIPISIIPLFFSSAMFLLTPSFIHAKMNAFFLNTFYPGCSEGDLRIKEYIASELKNISHAFKNLSGQLLSTSDARPYNSRAYSTALFDSVTSRVCAECPNSDLCWRENLNETCKQMFSIIDIMDTKGYCDMSNIPIIFSQKCRCPEKFITEFNHVYEMYKQNSLWQTEATLGRDLVARQYSEISSIIKELSSSVEYGFYFMEEAEDRIYKKCLAEKIPLSNVTVIESSNRTPEVYISPVHRIGNERLRKLISSAMDFPMRIFDETGDSIRLVADNLYYPDIAVKQKIKEGQKVSGDTVIYFESHENKFYVILCDGMGSGDEASLESKMTAELLREFIKADIKIETAISMINSSLALKTQREGFSTVDLLEINLLTGDICLFKVGGAQSYIKHGDKFETILSKSLPIGIIDDIKITQTKKDFHNGDMIVMVSDGVGEADYGAMRGEWIKKIMAFENRTTEELSSLIINDALKKVFPNSADDMTVVVIKLCKY